MKGYMIFVEGGHEPRVVHESYQTAELVAKKMAKKAPGKEVMLLQIHKRFKAEEGKEPEKMETHLPPPERPSMKNRTLGIKDLVFSKDAKKP